MTTSVRDLRILEFIGGTPPKEKSPLEWELEVEARGEK